MPDREKVIKDLDECLRASCRGFRPRLSCPYNDDEWDIMRDALDLLKEQEAVKPYQFEDIWKCGNCGDGVVAYEELGVSGIEEVKFDYCPTCGRRVLWKGR